MIKTVVWGEARLALPLAGLCWHRLFITIAVLCRVAIWQEHIANMYKNEAHTCSVVVKEL